MTVRVAVLASGGGTNLQAILDSLHGRNGVEYAQHFHEGIFPGAAGPGNADVRYRFRGA